MPDAPQLRRLAHFPVDLLVATPGCLVKLMEAGGLYLGDVRHVVLDEVDTMFDAGFGPELDAVLKITTRDLAADPRARGTGCVQHLAVGATHPEGARVLYQRWLGQARSLMVAGSHSLPPQLRQHFLTCNGPDTKMGALKMASQLKGLDTSKIVVDDDQAPPEVEAGSEKEAALLQEMEGLLSPGSCAKLARTERLSEI